jgi:hypothetical protein
MKATHDYAAYPFLRTLRDKINTHFNDAGGWHHGYWKQHEVHHGTEHF